jgi:trigger factor
MAQSRDVLCSIASVSEFESLLSHQVDNTGIQRMQVTLETTSGLERRMHITVPAEQLEVQVEAKLKQTAGQVRIKGFRPGKVPMREVRRRFGEGIRQEVSSELMQTSFAEAIQEHAVSPAGMPQIQDVKMESGKDLEFTAVFEVFPEITLKDAAAIEVERPVAEVTDADIDKMIETLREQRMQYVEVERPSQDKDKVNVDFQGFVDGEPFEGGEASGAEIVLGAGNMIAGFEEGLVGVKSGDEKELEIKFPDDYQSTELAGKDATFKIKVNSVAEPTMPDVDEAFMADFGVTEGGLDAFRAEVKANMQKELDAAVKNRVRTQVMDGLLKINEVELPQALVRQEVDRLRHEAIHQLGGHDKIDPSVLPAEMFEQQAVRRVSLGLIVNAIVEQSDIKLDDARVRAMIENMASSYQEPEQVVNFYYSNEQQLSQIQNLVLEEQVVDSILATAQVKETGMSYEEAVKPPQAAASAESDGGAEVPEEAGPAASDE